MVKYSDKGTEKTYQQSIRDIVLENGLGWESTQIEEQKSMQLGSKERLVPDIIVSKESRYSFVIEMKRADHIRTQKDIDQLVSYMKQLETSVGIYIGNNIEVYYKTIGDGADPVLIMSLNFNVNDPSGDDFVNLFSMDGFSNERITAYVEKQKADRDFENNVKLIVDDITTESFIIRLREFITDSYGTRGYSIDAINEALSKIDISITLHSEQTSCDKNICDYNIKESNNNSNQKHRNSNSSKRPNNGVAQRYAYNLVKQIIDKNSTLIFSQLYNIFGRKNYIEDINNVRDECRWFMSEEDILTSADGIRIVVSNQWGFNNNSKRKMDKLKAIAKEYGIDITPPSLFN